MGETYGDDLRGRVIAAVDGGMTRTAAAARFEVGKATAIAWLRAWRDEGRSSAKLKGGDTRSHRIEAFRDVFARRAITFKKRQRTLASRSGRTWSAAVRPGSTASPTLIPSG